MTSAVYILCALALFLILYFLNNVLRQALRPGLSSILGPVFSRYTNLPLKWHVLQGQRTKYIHSLHERYGTWPEDLPTATSLLMLMIKGSIVRISPNEVAVADYNAFREIHKPGTRFTKAAWYRKLSPNCVSEETAGILAMGDLQIHAARRKLFTHVFSNSGVLEWEDQIKQKVRIAVDKIRYHAATGHADIFMWWTFMASDIISELAFGEAFDVLFLEKVGCGLITGFCHEEN